MACQHIAVVIEIENITCARKSLLFSLAAACDYNGHWSLDRTALARMAGLSERSLRDNLKWLNTQGMVSIEGNTIALKL